MAKYYKDLDIYKVSFELFIRTHRFSLKLPKYETYEFGSQLRRSADSVTTNIVEGYGRRKYTKDFIRFLTYSYASNNEVISHLEKLKILYSEFEKESSSLLEEYPLQRCE